LMDSAPYSDGATGACWRAASAIAEDFRGEREETEFDPVDVTRKQGAVQAYLTPLNMLIRQQF